MPEIITCPDCGRKLRVPDTLVGKKVKCPDCNTKFTGGITTAPAGKTGAPSRSKPRDDDEDDRPKKSSRRDYDDRPRSRDRDDDEDYPRRRRRPDYDEDDDRDDRDRDRDRGPAPGLTREQKRSGWKMTLLGINLIVYAAYVLIAMVAVSLLGCSIMALFMGVGASSNNMNSGMGNMMAGGIVAMLLYLLLFLMYLAYVVLQVTGHGFCMAVPHKIGTARKAMAIATFAIACVFLLLGLGCSGATYSMRNNYANSGGGGFGPGPFFCLLPLLLAIGYHVCFMLFLRMVAQAMREPAVAKQVLIFMITLPCVIVATILAEILMAVVMFGSIWSTASSGGNTDYLAAGGIMGFICGILFLCIYIGLFVWYVMVIHQVRNAVKNYVG